MDAPGDGDVLSGWRLGGAGQTGGFNRLNAACNISSNDDELNTCSIDTSHLSTSYSVINTPYCFFCASMYCSVFFVFDYLVLNHQFVFFLQCCLCL